VCGLGCGNVRGIRSGGRLGVVRLDGVGHGFLRWWAGTGRTGRGSRCGLTTL
jgi:hypothetical protein